MPPPRAPDPHNLRTAVSRAGAAATVIDTDRECAACGYNLRGKCCGEPCPECGMIITLTPGADDNPLSVAPRRVILAFIRGCWAASIIIALAVGLVLAQRIPGWNAAYSRWGLLILAVLWVGAVMWLTPAFAIPEAASRGFSRRSRMRAVTRWTSTAWPVAAGMHLLQHELASGTAIGPLVGVVLGGSALIGLTGVVLLSIVLERLAEWARDDRAQSLFNWVTWTIPVTTLLLGVDAPMPVISLLLVALWLVGMGLFPYALVLLSGSVTLSIVHAYEHHEREGRRAQRSRRYQENVARTVETMDLERAKRGHV